MWQVIRDHIIYPLAGRAGTALSTGVLVTGISQQHADWLAIGVTIVCALFGDLAISRAQRLKLESKAVQKTLDGIRARTVAERDYAGIGGGQ